MPSIRRFHRGSDTVSRDGLEQLIVGARAAQGTPYVILTQPGGVPERDYGHPWSGPLFDEMMQGVDELLERANLRLSDLVADGWACVYGPGQNHNELPYVRRRFSGMERVFVVEAQRSCVDKITRDYVPSVPVNEQSKHVFVHGDADDLRWVLPDDCISFGLFFHLFDTQTLDDVHRARIAQEAGRVLRPDGVVLAVDLDASRVEAFMNAASVETVYARKSVFVGSPNPEVVKRRSR
jgi:SAM-dependent methyltransferase